MAEGNLLRYIGKFYRYQDLIRQKKKAGNIAICYIKKHKGYCSYIYNGKSWVFFAPPKMPITLAEEGKCVVIDKMRVMGKGWVLIIDDKPNGLEVGGKISNGRGMQYEVKGFGGWSSYKQIELILSPNGVVGVDINVGDILTVVKQ